MNIFLDNFEWISVNVLLAFLGAGFGYLFFYFKNKLLKIIFFIFWILFVPNTIYLITDLQYLPEQIIEVDFSAKFFILAQYIGLVILGIVTFIYGMRPLEKIISQAKIRDKTFITFIFIVVNYVIAFAVALGKLERVNSWEAFTDPLNVFVSSLQLLSSRDTIFLAFLFGTLSNIIYLTWRNKKSFKFK